MPSSLSWLTPPSRALVIGINQYAAPYISDLRGCVSDAHEMVAFLQEAGMAADHIRLLTSPAEGVGEQRATRAAIVAGIREFLGHTPSGEEALLYYSGHGSTTQLDPALQTAKRLGEPIVETDEEVHEEIEKARQKQEVTKNLGETFVPADARVDGVLELLDLELRYLLAELVAKGIRVTLIADSCYAGGVMRSGKEEAPPPPTTPVARLTNRDRVIRTLESLLDGQISQEQLRQLVQQELPIALIAGSLPSQFSFEQAGEGGVIRGLMTSTLLKVLRSANGPLSYREIGRALRASVPLADSKRQYPHVNSTRNRYLFSDEEAHRPRPVFVVQRATETGIRLDGGDVAGVEVGSELTCFADWTLSQPQGRWRVTQTTATSAEAVALEGGSAPNPGQPLQLDYVPNRPTVYFYPNATLVGNGWRHAARSYFLVELLSPPADYNVQAEGERWVTRRPDGQEVPVLSLPRTHRSHTDIALHLDQVACYERFIAEQSPATNALSRSPEGYLGGVELRLALVDGDDALTPLSTEPGTPPLPKGARVAITVQNHSADKERYAYVYRLDPERCIAQRLWPADDSAELQWGQSATTTWNDPKWEGGRLRFKLLVSSEPLDIERWPCGQDAIWRGGSAKTLRVLAEREQGWGIAYVEVGLPPA